MRTGQQPILTFRCQKNTVASEKYKQRANIASMDDSIDRFEYLSGRKRSLIRVDQRNDLEFVLPCPIRHPIRTIDRSPEDGQRTTPIHADNDCYPTHGKCNCSVDF